MTREQIEARMDALKTERDKFEGAIQDCVFWLAQLDSPIPVTADIVTAPVAEVTENATHTAE